MDENETIIPPYKKVKLESHSTSNHDIILSASHSKMSEAVASLLVDYDSLDKEVACGITEYVSPGSLGFSGVLKKRYTDFLVNEILPSGEVVHLNNLKAPKQKKAKDRKSLNGPGPENDRGQASFTAKSEIGDAVNGAKHKRPLDETSTSMMKQPNADSQEALTSGTVPRSSANEERQGIIPAAGDGSTANNLEALPPHKRLSAIKPVESRGIVESTGYRPEETARVKQKVHVRRTSQGWVEVDEEMEKTRKCQEDIQAAQRTANAGDDKVTGPGVSDRDEVPEEPNKVYAPQASTLGSWNAYAGVQDRFELSLEEKNTLESYFTAEFVYDIRSLYNRVLKSPGRPAREYGTVKSPIFERQARGQIHREIRRIFGSKLESCTDNEGHMIISAMPKHNISYGRRPPAQSDGCKSPNHETWKNSVARGKSRWKELGGDYLHFTLYKENKDTMESISYLARQLNMKPQAFHFAGTKDRRGVTVQRISAYRILIDRVINVGKTLFNAYVGDYEYHANPLQLGELTGNEFVITLRECDFLLPYEQSDAKTMLEDVAFIVGKGIKNLGEKGFINYYGLQRFGTFGISTDAVGIAMLGGDFKRAVDAILYYKPACLEPESDRAPTADLVSRDDRSRAQAIRLFQDTGDSSQALNDLPKKFSAETSIIRHLAKKGQQNDYLGALQSISRNLRLMYVHAYQSLVWNMAASERWRKYAGEVVEGDLVLINEFKSSDPAKKKNEIDADGEAVIQPAKNDRATSLDDIFSRARSLSKEEADSGRYTIFDIVLPTPGYDILYPDNAVTDFYRSFMASERGGGLDPHNMRRPWKDISLSGSYRKILAQPGKDISLEVKSYKDDDEQFVETDMDRYFKVHPEQHHRGQGRPFSKMPAAKEGSETNEAHLPSQPDDPATTDSNDIQNSIPVLTVPAPTSDKSSSVDTNSTGGVRLDGDSETKDNKKIAVILKLQLGTSQYATMALRELMKKGGVRTHKVDYSGGR